jgi:lysozyme
VTDRLRNRIEGHEGTRLVVYDDATGKPIVPGYTVVGHPTIGKGRCLDTKGISRAEAEHLFDNDIASAIKGAHSFHFFPQLDEVRQEALVELVFNLGVGGVKGFRRMLAALERRNFAEAAAELLDSDWRKQVGEKRAMALATMMSTGEYPEGE